MSSDSTPNFSDIGKAIRVAKRLWPKQVSTLLARQLSDLAEEFGVSVLSGDVQLLEGQWYVTHVGLIRIARRNRCTGINVEQATGLSQPAVSRWAFKATVYKSRTCKGFVGYGDADPSNVSPLVRGAEMRVAETRAVNRALRKAYGIGICSVEEIGSCSGASAPVQSSKKIPPQPVNGNSHVPGPRVRDRLCQLIRQHQLDPELVKSYAVDFCGTKALRDATREQVETFVAHLADWAEKDRNALLCQLKSYMGRKEGAACTLVLRHEDGPGGCRGIVKWVELPPCGERRRILRPESVLVKCCELLFASDLCGHPAIESNDVVKPILACQRRLLLRNHSGAGSEAVVLCREGIPFRRLVSAPRCGDSDNRKNYRLRDLDPLFSAVRRGSRMMAVLVNLVSKLDVRRCF
jgi:hypothetical protein